MVAFKNFFLATSILFTWAAASPTPPTSEAVSLNVLDKRNLFRTMNAAMICENEFAVQSDINNNGGRATIADLTGCTAVFFFKDNELRGAYHILCGNEESDGKLAAQGQDTANFFQVVTPTVNQAILVSEAIMMELGEKNVDFDTQYYPYTQGNYWFAEVTTGSRTATLTTGNRVCPSEEAKK